MRYVDRIHSQDHLDRVRALTPQEFNQKIDMKTRRKISEAKAQGPRAIRARLRELDREWDIDRVLLANFSALIFAQLLLGRKNRKWLLGPLVKIPFLFMQSTLGWSPPSLWLRPLGVRTTKEIQAEREALLSNLYSQDS